MPSARQAASVCGPGEVEQRPREEPSNDAPHPLQRPAAGAPGQPEQHGLGLVVEGVPEQHDARRRSARRAGRARRTSPRAPPPRCPPARGRRSPGSDAGLVDAQRGHLRDDPVGVLGRALLQPVVDGDADDPPGARARLEDASRPAGPASRRRPSRRPATVSPASRSPGSGVRRAGPRPPRDRAPSRLSRGRARSTAPGRGSPSWWAGWPAPPRRR